MTIVDSKHGSSAEWTFKLCTVNTAIVLGNYAQRKQQLCKVNIAVLHSGQNSKTSSTQQCIHQFDKGNSTVEHGSCAQWTQQLNTAGLKETKTQNLPAVVVHGIWYTEQFYCKYYMRYSKVRNRSWIQESKSCRSSCQISEHSWLPAWSGLYAWYSGTFLISLLLA
jgi:hypothetical protein